MIDIDKLLEAYITAALWAETDDKEEPFDKNYSADDLSAECRASMRADCEAFAKRAAEQLTEENYRGRGSSDVSEAAGHDFWLTRGHHGAGFWDGDWNEPAATALTEAAQSFPECWLYVGDDGKIYLS